MRDFRDSKAMARTLRDALAEKSIAFTQSESLELVSKMFGLANWNVLAAKIETTARPIAAQMFPPRDSSVRPTNAKTPRTLGISPFLIVSNVGRSIAFYRDKLGFEPTFVEPTENPFFAVICRDQAQMLIKSEGGITPVPNHTRHGHLRWDAYIYAPDPDSLAADFAERGAVFSAPLTDTNDGLRGFEVKDPDGYVLFFGRPRPD